MTARILWRPKISRLWFNAARSAAPAVGKTVVAGVGQHSALHRQMIDDEEAVASMSEVLAHANINVLMLYKRFMVSSGLMHVSLSGGG
jgi:hypothetical protein